MSPDPSISADLKAAFRSPPALSGPERLRASTDEAVAPFQFGRTFQDEVRAKRMFGSNLTWSDLRDARQWEPGADVPSGTRVNQAITAMYAEIDRDMTRYLGEPQRPNWATFGKFASRNAGEQIVRLEAIEKACKLDAGSGLALLKEFARNPKQGLSQARALMGGETRPQAFLENARKLRQALVFGNTAIIEEIAPAYRIFLKAEAEGKNGVDALRNAGYGRMPKDPQMFVLKAFHRYRAAKAIGEDIQRLGPKPPATAEVRELQKARDRLLLEANLHLGLQEQYLTLQTQDVFNDPEIKRLMGKLSRSMNQEDANGTTRLLPGGGNWANFLDRMGLKEGTERELDAIKGRNEDVIDVEMDGRMRFLVPTGQPGTIATYFSAAAADPRMGQELLFTDPPPLSFRD